MDEVGGKSSPVDCPAWEDGKHLFVPTSHGGSYSLPNGVLEQLRAPQKECACGARVERARE